MYTIVYNKLYIYIINTLFIYYTYICVYILHLSMYSCICITVYTVMHIRHLYTTVQVASHLNRVNGLYIYYFHKLYFYCMGI